MNNSSMVSFENTSIAFKSKNNQSLRKSNWLFSMMNNQMLVKVGTRAASLALNLHLPVNGLIKATIFSQFCGGETLQETVPVVADLKKYNVLSILDYAVEAKEGEAEFEHTMNELLSVIDFAATAAVPFISVKVTGLARFSLLEKIHAKETITVEEQEEFRRVKERLKKICEAGFNKKVNILVDAEETWIQDPVDALVNAMMYVYNKETPVVYNTIQFYRHDRLAYMRKCMEMTKATPFIYAVKLVRGAYMEKERKRAAQLNYPSPIQPDKAASDRDYDLGVLDCLNQIESVAFFCASHNEDSALKAIEVMKQKNIPANHPHIYFSQLYGMSDHITFNLAAAGYNVCKYLPYGPIKDVMPYLIRRAQENTAIAGQMSRELKLIKKEIGDRKK